MLFWEIMLDLLLIVVLIAFGILVTKKMVDLIAEDISQRDVSKINLRIIKSTKMEEKFYLFLAIFKFVSGLILFWFFCRNTFDFYVLSVFWGFIWYTLCRIYLFPSYKFSL